MLDKNKIRRKLRKYPTYHEILFKKKLKRWRIHFEFQKIMSGFIVDFYLPKYDIAIELDGCHHDNQKQYDKWRDGIIGKKGTVVKRFYNSDALELFPEDFLPQVRIPVDTTRQWHNDYLKTITS